MRIFIKRYGYELSNTTMHKYINKELNLCAVIMHSKPGYRAGKKNKIFDNLLNQIFTVDCKNKVWCTDFTYMRQPNGKFRYNCSIIDLFDRSTVASLNSDYINMDLAINTLKTALKKTILKWFCIQISEYSLPHGILWISVKIIIQPRAWVRLVVLMIMLQWKDFITLLKVTFLMQPHFQVWRWWMSLPWNISIGIIMFVLIRTMII